MGSVLEWISLSLSPGLGITGVWRLLQSFKTPKAILSASAEQLLRVQGIRQSQIEGLLAKNHLRKQAEQQVARLHKFGGDVLIYDDPSYPSLLKQLIDPPVVLYLQGNKELLLEPKIAMVGSRAATGYGRRVAFSLAQQLAARGTTVVSGLAAGIDAESHKGAMHRAGNTIAVLGCGLDVVYPRSNGQLYNSIRKDGLIISEYPLGTRPEGFRFPARNRIIAGLSHGVLVVEAAKRSGSLITAQIALDIGREVFAVPGQIDSHKSEGAHYLLQQGAKLVQSVDDIVEELPIEVKGDTGQEKAGPNSKNDLDMEPDAVALLQEIDHYPQLRQQLIDKCGLAPSRVNELLLLLELEGLVEVVPGDKIRLM